MARCVVKSRRRKLHSAVYHTGVRYGYNRRPWSHGIELAPEFRRTFLFGYQRGYDKWLHQAFG